MTPSDLISPRLVETAEALVMEAGEKNIACIILFVTVNTATEEVPIIRLANVTEPTLKQVCKIIAHEV